MQKAETVYDWLNSRFEDENGRAFTAGECARGAGVATNTAKKWLTKITQVENALVSTWKQDMPNGKIVTLFRFNERAQETWR